jgi:hypothetical protein
MKTESGASGDVTLNFIRALAPTVGFNVTQRTFRVGDVVNFNFTVKTVSAATTVRFGIADSNGAFLASHSETVNVAANQTTRINHTMKVTRAGTFNIRILNPSGNVAYIVEGVCIYRPRITHDTMIRYDTTARNYYGGAPSAESAIRTAFSSATREFDRFGIFFNAHSPAFSVDLNGGDCPQPVSETCRLPGLIFNYCGALNRCATDHHKGTRRLLNMHRVSNTFSVRVVGHVVCQQYGNDHHIGDGVAIAPLTSTSPIGRDSVVNVGRHSTGLTLPAIIQHELTHNLGVANHCIFLCVMNRDFNEIQINQWCSSCTAHIVHFRNSN